MHCWESWRSRLWSYSWIKHWICGFWFSEIDITCDKIYLGWAMLGVYISIHSYSSAESMVLMTQAPWAWYGEDKEYARKGVYLSSFSMYEFRLFLLEQKESQPGSPKIWNDEVAPKGFLNLDSCTPQISFVLDNQLRKEINNPFWKIIYLKNLIPFLKYHSRKKI